VISLDPGVRTFMTGYDPSGMAVEWGKMTLAEFTGYVMRMTNSRAKRDQIHGKRNKRKRYR